MNERILGGFLVTLSAIGFGLMPVFTKYAYEGGATVLETVVWRFAIAVLLLWIFVFLTRQDLKKFKDIKYGLAILCCAAYWGMAFFYPLTVKLIPGSLASLLLYIFPLIVTVFAFILGDEKINPIKILLLLTAFAGLLLVLGQSLEGGNIPGILAGLASALCYSTYIITGNRVAKNTGTLLFITMNVTATTLFYLLISLFTEGIPFDVTPRFAMIVVLLGVFSTIGPMLLLFFGMKMVGPSTASIISMLEPVTTIILWALLFDSILSLLQLLGGAAILLSGIGLVTYKEKPLKQTTQKAE